MLELYFFNHQVQEVDIGGKDFIERLELRYITDLGDLEFCTTKENHLLYVISKNKNNEYTVKVWELGFSYKIGDSEGISDEEIIDIYNKEEFQGWLLIKKTW
ncbi:MAG: hypothetical protein QXY70_02670 [Nanopusillaceae archaeon]